jgi:O-antigen/teichoic acid export membrane protein
MLDTVAAESGTLADRVTPPLRYGVARAALASGVVETVSRVLTIVLSIATARALEPREVGLLGLAVIVIGIVSLVAACSETAGVITRGKGSDHQHAFVATSIRAVVAIVLVGATYVCLSLISHLLVGGEAGEPQVVALIRVMLLLPLIEVVSNYPRVVLQRRLDLSFLAGTGLIQVVIHVGLSIALLWLGYGAMGVVCSSLISASVAAIVAWSRMLFSHRGERLRAAVRTGLFGEVLKNTSKVFAGSFVGYLNGRVDNLLVSGAIGPTAMSFYGMAWNASRVAPQVMGQAVGFVLVPTLAQIQTDIERVGRALTESIRHSYLVVAPVAAGLFVSAPSLVMTMLGPKWLPMVPCLRVMCVAMLAGPLIAASNAQLVASGRAHMTGLATVAQLAALTLVIIPLSRRWGILGAAFGDLVAVSLVTIALLFLTPALRRMLKQVMLVSVFVPVVASFAAGFTSWSASQQLTNGGPKLLVQAGILLVSYPLILSLVGGRAAIREFLNLLRNGKERVPATLSSS